MPLRDPTPDELKELGVAMATPTQPQPSAALLPKSQSPYSLQQSQPILSAGAADVLPPMQYQKALPYMFGAPGQAAKEGLDYLGAGTPEGPKEPPTALGAATRVGTMMAIPWALKAGGRAVAPLVEKAAPMLSEIAPIAKETFSKVGSAIKTVTQKGLTELTASRAAKDAMLADLESQGYNLPTGPLLYQLKNKFVPFAKTEMEGLINEIQKAAGNTGYITLPKLQMIVREGWKDANSAAAKQAMKAFNNEFKEQVSSYISKSQPQLAQKFLELTEETGSRLRTYEKLAKAIGMNTKTGEGGKNAINAAKHLMYDDKARLALKEVDRVAGTNFSEQLDKLVAHETAITQRIAQRGATQEANAALQKAQDRARSVMYGLIGALSGLASKGGAIGAGGGFIGGEATAFLMNRLGGASLIEPTLARGVQGLGAISIPATAGALQVVSEEPDIND